jgi:hypothetical protein
MVSSLCGWIKVILSSCAEDCFIGLTHLRPGSGTRELLVSLSILEVRHRSRHRVSRTSAFTARDQGQRNRPWYVASTLYIINRLFLSLNC